MLRMWQEVGRHGTMVDTLPRVFAMLHAESSVTACRVFEISREEGSVNLKHTWHYQRGFRALYRNLNVSRAARASLLPYLDKNTHDVFQLSGNSKHAELVASLQINQESYLLSLPLLNGHYILFCFEAENATDRTLSTLMQSQPVFEVMMSNDYRLRELQQLRSAAEAERDLLLSRLGRTSVSSELIIGSDGGLRGVMQRVSQVAPTNVSALLLGETGSGKEVIARAIHEHSSRGSGPFIRVNCGALPAELIDSELFGHEKGSFTGATGSRRGWFERASGGTLFLDEVAELTLPAQVRLLRVLQDGIIQRVGSEKSIDVDVRVVAATHRDLASMVRTGEFREDLWYRLAVFPIILPAVRDRPEDIEPLAQHFIKRAAQKLGVPAPTLKQHDITRLKHYAWPGNVRELSAVLERAVILGYGKTLDLESALGGQLLQEKKAPAMVAATQMAAPDIEPLDDIIIKHIQRALKQTHGRVDGKHGAAKLLKLNANTLRGKLRRYNIDANLFKQ